MPCTRASALSAATAATTAAVTTVAGRHTFKSAMPSSPHARFLKQAEASYFRAVAFLLGTAARPWRTLQELTNFIPE